MIKASEDNLKEQTDSFELKSPQEEEARLDKKIRLDQASVNELNEQFNTLSATIKSKKELLKKYLAEKSDLEEKQKTSKLNLENKLTENNFESITALQEALLLENSGDLSAQKLDFDNKNSNPKEL